MNPNLCGSYPILDALKRNFLPALFARHDGRIRSRVISRPCEFLPHFWDTHRALSPPFALESFRSLVGVSSPGPAVPKCAGASLRTGGASDGPRRPLRAEAWIQILNDVVLYQVLVRVVLSTGDADAATCAALKRVQNERVCWLGGTRWRGIDALRISVSNWSTTDADVDRSADSILHAVRA